MKLKFLTAVASVCLAVTAFAQSEIRVEAPNVVSADEQFNVTFIIEGEDKLSDFSWSQGDDFQLLEALEIVSGQKAPAALKELKGKPVRFESVIEKNEMKQAVLHWLED